ncbi:hypothetical protein WICMUC_002673 [Wickerhamomyces mucosus]|uniref:Zn(2)-C6 fungal-type domain-containing protein n=1 Tax=Wickerhamomyces mucosus TaxID=1378264 RepID=A0A9P8PQP5_9ASCO|nr:hypothetical protein WICMUC_002673 [Wickerhamomyces mucosus]
MSDNFTDTSHYAVNLTRNSNDIKSNTTSTDQSSPNNLNQPLQPQPQPQQQIKPLSPSISTNSSIKEIRPSPIQPKPILQKNFQPPILPANSKKRNNQLETSKPKKKQTKPKIEDSNNGLHALATIATTPDDQQKHLHNHIDQHLPIQQQAGHRPVTSCTHCRQHKIKCNALERFPASCSRCDKMNLKCEIDPQFRPKKGSQIQSLRNDVDELKLKIEYLQRNESLIAQALAQNNNNNNNNSSNNNNNNNNNINNNAQFSTKNEHAPQVSSPLNTVRSNESPIPTKTTTTTAMTNNNNNNSNSNDNVDSNSPTTSLGKTVLKREPHLLNDRRTSSLSPRSNDSPQLLNDSAPSNSHQNELPPLLEYSVRSNSTPNLSKIDGINSPILSQRSNSNFNEFILGDVSLSLQKANELHKRFVENYLPFFPIISSSTAQELYSQSQLLFWTVCLTACLSDSEPTLYNKLSSLIKQLAIETCWIRTPRSTHISQALLILCIWPLPNQKVLDDTSYRFVGLAKSLGYQLGLHRGKFMSEFSRTQVSLEDAEKWRTRTWLGIFFAEQYWASQLGLPPSSQTDYLIENARIDKDLPKNFRSLISLSIFQAKLVNVMGSSVISPDGLMEARNRAGSLAILERELERLVFKLEIGDDISIEIYYLYVKLTICCFAFLPETPTEDQTKYVTIAYLAATKVITLVSKLLESKNLIELPIYIRQSVTYAALILFKLHLTPLLLDKYIDSARQSIVTVHRLFRNQLSAWKNVENDISRTAQVLEKLNFVLFTHPELYTKNEGIITRMRSHLTGSLFYDLVWCIHEARRRTLEEQKSGKHPPSSLSSLSSNLSKQIDPNLKKPVPLPFYNQINKDDFQTITTTTPGGTTITTLVPTENAMSHATANATANGLSKPTEIKGIPVSMLESTGSIPASVFTNSNGRSTIDSIVAQSQIKPTNDYNKNESSYYIVPSSSTMTPNQSKVHIQENYPSNIPSPAPVISNRTFQEPLRQVTFDGKSQLPYNFAIETQSPNRVGFDINSSNNGNNNDNKNNFNNNENNANNKVNENANKNNETNNNDNDDDFNQFFQQQSANWSAEGNDDFLGWFDMNMAPEF